MSQYDPLPEYRIPLQGPAPPTTEAVEEEGPALRDGVSPTSEDEPGGLDPDPLATWFSSDGPSRDFWSRPGRRGAEGQDGRWRYRVAVRLRR